MSLTSLNDWLAKQSPAMLDAKRRGLVPQTGDWNRPYRWVTPEEVEEIEPPKEVGPIKQPWEMTQEEFIANPKNIQPVYNKVSPPALYEEITQALQIAIE